MIGQILKCSSANLLCSHGYFSTSLCMSSISKEANCIPVLETESFSVSGAAEMFHCEGVHCRGWTMGLPQPWTDVHIQKLQLQTLHTWELLPVAPRYLSVIGSMRRKRLQIICDRSSLSERNCWGTRSLVAPSVFELVYRHFKCTLNVQMKPSVALYALD